MAEKQAVKKVETQARAKKAAKPAPNAAKVETRTSKMVRIH